MLVCPYAYSAASTGTMIQAEPGSKSSCHMMKIGTQTKVSTSMTLSTIAPSKSGSTLRTRTRRASRPSVVSITMVRMSSRNARRM